MSQVVARTLNRPVAVRGESQSTPASRARRLLVVQSKDCCNPFGAAAGGGPKQRLQRVGQQQQHALFSRTERVVFTRASADVSTTSRVRHVENEEEFDAVLAEGGVTIVDYYAEWCGPCKIIAPAFERLSQAKTCAKVNFIKVDIGKFPKEFASKYGVRALPTFHAFVDGEIKDTFVGSRSQELVCFVDRQV